jgi:rhodanese-related sulfurtransferase
MSPAEVQALLAKRAAVLVDVREGEERHEVVEPSRWLPMSTVRDDKAWTAFVRELPKDKLVVFYCAAGVRAKSAAELLRAEGLATAYFDGPDQWKAAGLAVAPGPAK